MRQAVRVSADPGQVEIDAAEQAPGWPGARGGWSRGGAGSRSAPGGWRRELLALIGLLVAGVLLAVVWRLLAPETAKLGDEQEAAAAVDGTLALFGVVAGVLTAAFFLFRPGPAPAVRAVTTIVGTMLGAVVSWKVGDLLGTPHLRATGAAFVWPAATAAALFVGALLPGTSNRLQPTEPELGPFPPYPPGTFTPQG
jgi:hypothetical protein